MAIFAPAESLPSPATLVTTQALHFPVLSRVQRMVLAAQSSPTKLLLLSLPCYFAQEMKHARLARSAMSFSLSLFPSQVGAREGGNKGNHLLQLLSPPITYPKRDPNWIILMPFANPSISEILSPHGQQGIKLLSIHAVVSGADSEIT